MPTHSSHAAGCLGSSRIPDPDRGERRGWWSAERGRSRGRGLAGRSRPRTTPQRRCKKRVRMTGARGAWWPSPGGVTASSRHPFPIPTVGRGGTFGNACPAALVIDSGNRAGRPKPAMDLSQRRMVSCWPANLGKTISRVSPCLGCLASDELGCAGHYRIGFQEDLAGFRQILRQARWADYQRRSVACAGDRRSAACRDV